MSSSSLNSLPPIRAHEVFMVEKLGSGSFGKVFKGICRDKEVAVKVLDKQTLAKIELQLFIEEANILSLISHPNIVQFMGACFEPGNLMIVTELMPKGHLGDLLFSNKQLSFVVRMVIAREIATGMSWLHKSNPMVIHRDLKPTNILVGDNYRIKICDFGLSQVKIQQQIQDGKTVKGTPIYMAPEVMSRKPFDERIDVYSFGLILWSLITREEPYEEYRLAGNGQRFASDIVLAHVRPPIPENCPQRLVTLMTRCWNPDPTKRPGFDEIIQELNLCIIEPAIEEVFWRDFWYKHFRGKETLHWDEFSEKFFLHINSNLNELNAACDDNLVSNKLQNTCIEQLLEFQTNGPREYKLAEQEFLRRGLTSQQAELNIAYAPICLRALLINQTSGEEEVNIEKFGQIISLFGPSFEGDQFVLLDRIVSVLKQPWFHGDIDGRTADDRLDQKDIGTFLVRISESSPDKFTLSWQNLPVLNMKIYRTSTKGYTIDEQNSFRTLNELIEALVYSSNPRLVPCGGSRFSRLFSFNQTSSYIKPNIQ